jgi:CRISPR-associated endonuclease/helicase Cas3
MKLLVESAEEVLGRHKDDPLSLRAVEEYFRQIYWLKNMNDGLDRHGILDLLNKGRGQGWFPFESVAQLFKIIEDGMKAVLIPFDADAERLITKLKVADDVGRLARKLQPYIVNVPDKAFRELRRTDAVQPVNEARFGEQFCKLEAPLYRDDVGLLWDDPTFRDAESCMF